VRVNGMTLAVARCADRPLRASWR